MICRYGIFHSPFTVLPFAERLLPPPLAKQRCVLQTPTVLQSTNTRTNNYSNCIHCTPLKGNPQPISCVFCHFRLFPQCSSKPPRITFRAVFSTPLPGTLSLPAAVHAPVRSLPLLRGLLPPESAKSAPVRSGRRPRAAVCP